METIEMLQIAWFFIIGFLLTGYAILDGFDLGVGALMPLMAKNDGERQSLFNMIWPFWDGNEVWLITGGMAIFAAFPHAYATVFSGFYLAMMLVLFALIFRAVSIEFWHYDEKRRALWGAAFTVGSLIPALLFGVALGNVVLGVPLGKDMEYAGNFFTLLRPYPLAIGLLGLAAILLQGSLYTSVRTDGALRERARALTSRIWIFYIAAFALAFVMAAVFTPGALSKWTAWLAGALTLVALAAVRVFHKKNDDTGAFISASCAFAGLWAIAGATHFPNLVTAGNDAALSITITNASSARNTLSTMLIVAGVALPAVIAYTIFVYRVFKGKASVMFK